MRMEVIVATKLKRNLELEMFGLNNCFILGLIAVRSAIDVIVVDRGALTDPSRACDMLYTVSAAIDTDHFEGTFRTKLRPRAVTGFAKCIANDHFLRIHRS